MIPHDDIHDSNEHENFIKEGKDIYSEDTSSTDSSDTQLQEFQPRLRKRTKSRRTITHPSIHAATLSDAAYQDNYTIQKYNLEMDQKMYYWPVKRKTIGKRKIIEHSLLILQKRKEQQKVGNAMAEKYTTEPTLLAMNKELFKYLKSRSSEEEAIEIMYQLERLMERIVRTRSALRQQALLVDQNEMLRAAGWRSVLRFAEDQFAGNQELLTRLRTRLHALFPTSIQYLANEGRKRRKVVSTKTPSIEEGGTAEAPETSSLSLGKESSQLI